MYEVVDYETKFGGIILDSSQAPANIVTIKGESSRNPEIETNAFCFPVSNLQTCSPEYLLVMEKKAHLVIRMLEHRYTHRENIKGYFPFIRSKLGCFYIIRDEVSFGHINIWGKKCRVRSFLPSNLLF